MGCYRFRQITKSVECCTILGGFLPQRRNGRKNDLASQKVEVTSNLEAGGKRDVILNEAVLQSE